MDTEPDFVPRVLLGAVLFTIGADGRVDEREERWLRAACVSMPELRGVDVAALLPTAGQALLAARDAPIALREKAYVLGVEAVTRGNEADFQSDPSGLQAVQRLGMLLRITDEDVATGALSAARTKYIAGDLPAEHRDTILDAAVAVAIADGEAREDWMAPLATLLATVPQLEDLDLAPAVAAARQRLSRGEPALVTRLRALPKFRDKTFSIAADLAYAIGLPSGAERVLGLIESSVALSPDLPLRARRAFAAKHARLGGGVANGGGTLEGLAPLVEPALRAGEEQLRAGNAAFAVLVVERAKERTIREASNRFLPRSKEELMGLLATQLADADRYAIVVPGLSLDSALSGTVLSVESGDRASPDARVTHLAYRGIGPSVELLGPPSVAGEVESLLFRPAPSGSLQFVIEDFREEANARSASCRLGTIAFRLGLTITGEVPGVSGVSFKVGVGTVDFDSREAAASFVQGLGAERPVPRTLTATASVVVLTERGRRAGEGFRVGGGHWLLTKWTFQSDRDAVEVYVNLRPLMRHGELAPKSARLSEVGAMLGALLAR